MAVEYKATEQQPSQPINAKPILWGESFGFWIQTGALVAAAIFAWVAIRNSRAIERRKAAAGVIFSTRKDTELVDCIRCIGLIHASTKNIASFAKNDQLDTDETKKIRYALNHYEYIAVGISQGIYDENIFKSSSYNTVVKLYEHTKAYIAERRKVTQRVTAYQEFECLACRWNGDPLKQKKVKMIPG